MRMRRRLVAALLGVCLGFVGCGQGLVADQAYSARQDVHQVSLDVPYVPTPHEVVDEMLRLANLHRGDILYDLGSGDGRIVITAAQRYGVRGVGVDLDPDRIAESKANAQRAGVADRVQFVQGDLFQTDLSGASAVTLYLLSSVNERLRPKLFQELKPGTPVVSHSFGMGEWEPDRTTSVNGHEIFLWIIPAHAAGTWNLSVDSAAGMRPLVLNLQQDFQKVNGAAYMDGHQVQVDEGRILGEAIRFSLTQRSGGNDVTNVFIGRITGDSMQGIVDDPSGGEERRSWTAHRATASAAGFSGDAQLAGCLTDIDGIRQGGTRGRHVQGRMELVRTARHNAP